MNGKVVQTGDKKKRTEDAQENARNACGIKCMGNIGRNSPGSRGETRKVVCSKQHGAPWQNAIETKKETHKEIC